MGLDDPWALFSGLVIGSVGLGLFICGKKQLEWRYMLAGTVMCIFPYFVGSVAMMWLITGCCVAALYAAMRFL
jgi:hypothetical protein